ncbi:MAG: hypothetical protein AB7D28_09410 [Candidatus Berkiella sp.]
MSPFFIVLNFIAIAYAIMLLFVVTKKYKYYFLIGCTLPLFAYAVVGMMTYGLYGFTVTQFGLFLLRGGLIASILSGTLVNFLLSRLSEKSKQLEP